MAKKFGVVFCDIPKVRQQNRLDRAAFWRKVKAEHPEILMAKGCYIFGLRNGNNIKPWYVGQAAKQNFQKEIFTPHKREKYQNCIHENNGQPVLFFIAALTHKGSKIADRKDNSDVIDWLEKQLILKALAQNPKLENIQNIKYAKETVVPGFMHTPKGKGTEAERQLKKMLSKK